ncbi:hypothetical protein LCGC14_0208140 [marine sediment metagenome]|uniref:Uncharacterized protein n=1 Tax=marine sediment metagenome TaxID=412755 RepID=A0A0F9XJT0_9ZZZZ
MKTKSVAGSVAPTNDRHPRSRKAYRKDPLKREDHEAEKYHQSNATPIIQGDWKLCVYPGKRLRYRQYHRHGKRWYTVISYFKSSSPKEDYPGEDKWKCGHCSEQVPEEMEGYINLARWAVDDN